MKKATTTIKKTNSGSEEGKFGDSQPGKDSGPSAGTLIDARIK